MYKIEGAFSEGLYRWISTILNDVDEAGENDTDIRIKLKKETIRY